MVAGNTWSQKHMVVANETKSPDALSSSFLAIDEVGFIMKTFLPPSRLFNRAMVTVIMTCAIIVMPLLLAPSVRAQPASRPNVVLIITDDQGFGDFSTHGNPHLETPNIDMLAAQSVRFDRFFVNSFCAPTRAALLTGRWPLRTGCHGVTHNREVMRSTEVTIAKALRSGGYYSTCIGKWHNGEQYPFTPQGQGFDEAFGFNNGHWNNYFDPALLRGTQSEPTMGYITDVLTTEAMKFISSRKSKPFFCYVSYNAPHSPFQVPDPFFDKFKAKGFDDTLAAYYGMCENVDQNVGRLLEHLDSEQLSDNTIVLFLTDNGGTAGVKTYNAGMRGGKTSVHEGGSRVPLFVRWPRANWKPHTVKPIVSHIDLYPTILDLCDVAPPAGPAIDGVSLRPLLESSDESAWPARSLFTHNPIDETNRFPGAVRTQQYRLVCEIRGPAGGSSAKANDASATPWQLYDMQRDPGQNDNIANQHPEIVERLSQQYDRWFADISTEGLSRIPIPIGYPNHDPVTLQAPQAYYDKPLAFSNGPGFAHDWLTHWTDPNAKVWFEVEVVTAGEYAVELAFACPETDAGSQVRISAIDKSGDEESIEASVQAAEGAELALAHRDEKGKSKYRNRQWGTLRIGTLSLNQGTQRIVIDPITMPGSEVMDFKHLKLTRRSN